MAQFNNNNNSILTSLCSDHESKGGGGGGERERGRERRGWSHHPRGVGVLLCTASFDDLPGSPLNLHSLLSAGEVGQSKRPSGLSPGGVELDFPPGSIAVCSVPVSGATPRHFG